MATKDFTLNCYKILHNLILIKITAAWGEARKQELTNVNKLISTLKLIK